MFFTNEEVEWSKEQPFLKTNEENLPDEEKQILIRERKELQKHWDRAIIEVLNMFYKYCDCSKCLVCVRKLDS